MTTEVKYLRERCKNLYQSLAGHMVTECFEIADCARIQKFAREMIIEGRRQMREEVYQLAKSDELELVSAKQIGALKTDAVRAYLSGGSSQPLRNALRELDSKKEN